MSAFEFEFRTITGEALPLSRFEGKPVLIVNTASRCGFRPQYRELSDRIIHLAKTCYFLFSAGLLRAEIIRRYSDNGKPA